MRSLALELRTKEAVIYAVLCDSYHARLRVLLRDMVVVMLTLMLSIRSLAASPIHFAVHAADCALCSCTLLARGFARDARHR